MGTGIKAAIPLIFTPREQRRINESNFTQGFFDFFDVEETDTGKIYTIKQDILLNNYKSFLAEFYELIDEDFFRATKLTYDDLPDMNSMDDFYEFFIGENRGNRTPFIYDISGMFDVRGCECEHYWLFYSGSYKAYLEEYKTLAHFEKILAKAMKNPLANAVKFGIFG